MRQEVEDTPVVSITSRKAAAMKESQPSDKSSRNVFQTGRWIQLHKSHNVANLKNSLRRRHMKWFHGSAFEKKKNIIVKAKWIFEMIFKDSKWHFYLFIIHWISTR